MKNYGKRMTSLVMMLLLCVVAVFGNVTTAKAAEDGVLLAETGVAAANTEVSYNFSTSKSTNVLFALYSPTPADCAFTINNSAGNVYDTFSVTAAEWVYVEELQLYGYGFEEYTMPVGDYVFKFVAASDIQYAAYVQEEAVQPTLNQTKATVSVGMKCTLKVDNTNESIKWKSSKKSVATVSQKGVVTGKKVGKATITATTESGVELKCTVTVKANKFTETKLSVKDLRWDEKGVLQVYGASYDSKGNLVVKCRFINNCGYRVTQLKGIKIKMISAEGKTIGTYSAKSKSLSVANGATKDFSVTIKKSSLKIKKADLRNATYKTDGEYYYTY